ncbi:MAG: hypothetical protein GY855_07555 [candidate division Zixibacteria bacterium]|nr:hypothetical protein [candidate division Zixibacteria bacterium]
MKNVTKIVVILLLCFFIVGVFQPVYAGIACDRMPISDDRIAGGEGKKSTEFSLLDLLMLHFDFVIFRR